MSLFSPFYVKFKVNDIILEGEFIPIATDYVSYIEPYKLPLDSKIGFIRPIERDLRQQIIDKNLKSRDVSYEEWIRVGELIDCDAFSTSDVEDIQIVDREELEASEEDILLTKKDIIHRIYFVASGLPDCNPEFIEKAHNIFDSINVKNYKPLRYKYKSSLWRTCSKIFNFLLKSFFVIGIVWVLVKYPLEGFSVLGWYFLFVICVINIPDKFKRGYKHYNVELTAKDSYLALISVLGSAYLTVYLISLDNLFLGIPWIILMDVGCIYYVYKIIKRNLK
jgi:hypothetical protein